MFVEIHDEKGSCRWFNTDHIQEIAPCPGGREGYWIGLGYDRDCVRFLTQYELDQLLAVLEVGRAVPK